MKITAICCENSGWKAAQSLRGKPAMESVEVVKVPCAGRIEVGDILRRFEGGAGPVLVIGCPLDNCKHVKGNCRALKRVKAARQALTDAGLDGNTLRMEMISSVDGHKLAAILEEMRTPRGTP